MKTKHEIIDETAQAYSDPQLRAVIPSNFECQILMIDGRKCALGRCMKDETAQIFRGQSGPDLTLGSGVKNEEIDALLKEEYRGHDKFFWAAIQEFHDIDRHWESQEAIDAKVAELKARFRN
jgi:hypothetical protein